MKKKFFVAVLLAVTLLLTACSQTASPTEATTATVDEAVATHEWQISEQRVFDLAYEVSDFSQVDRTVRLDADGEVTAESLTYQDTDDNNTLQWLISIQALKNSTLSSAISKYVGDVDELESQKFNNIDFRIFNDSDYGTYYACCLIDSNAYVIFYTGKVASLQVFAEFLNSVEIQRDHADDAVDISLSPLTYTLPGDTETSYEIRETATSGIVYKSAGFGSMTNVGALIEYKPSTSLDSVVAELIASNSELRLTDVEINGQTYKLNTTEDSLSRNYITQYGDDVYSVNIMWRDGNDDMLNEFLNSLKFSEES